MMRENVNIETLLLEDDERKKKLFPEYDPILGIGSPIKRSPVLIDDVTPMYVPDPMLEEPKVKAILQVGSLQKAAALLDIEDVVIVNDFAKLRCKYDFEFWAASCVWIRGKVRVQRFTLNLAQRKFFSVIEGMRLAGVPIRIILLKARQWGGSTLTQIYIAWLQLFWTRDYNAMVVAQVKDTARHILGMYEFMATKHPQDMIEGLPNGIRLVPYMRTSNYRTIAGVGNVMGVTSVENPDSPRGFTWQLLHLSELSSWKSTAEVSAEGLAASLVGSLVDAPNTLCVKESTAKGVGNYFHREWQRAVRGESNDVPIFVSWIDQQDTLAKVANRTVFIESMSEYEWWLWDMGACIEQIAWYRRKRKDYPTDMKMKSEHPTTAEEAFQSTGARVFPQPYVLRARRNCREPLLTGFLTSDGTKGKDALRNITFHRDVRGLLKVWHLPNSSGLEKPGMRYTNRYVAFGDVGGRTERADWSVVTILDRIYTLIGGVPVVAATWRGHKDQDLFAWDAAKLAAWYDNALLAIEVNSLKADSGDEERGFSPNHALTVLDTIKDFYDNLYYRVRPQTIQEKWDGVIGFHTNVSTKPMIIDCLNAALRDDGYEERDLRACDEMDYFEFKQNGTMGAVLGENDDFVVSRSGSLYVSSQMDPVREISDKEKTGTGRKGGFAVFS